MKFRDFTCFKSVNKCPLNSQFFSIKLRTARINSSICYLILLTGNVTGTFVGHFTKQSTCRLITLKKVSECKLERLM